MYTILQRGSFTVGASVIAQKIAIPSGANFMWVKNFTQMAAAGGTAPAIGYDFYWQQGMAAGSAMVAYKTNTLLTRNDDIITSGGFTLVDPSATSTSDPVVGAAVVTTAATNATQPAVSATVTPNVGDIVQKYDAQSVIDGIPMYVSAVTAGASFTLLTATNALKTAPGLIGGAGKYRVVSYPMFYPRVLYITNITGTTSLTIATSVQHGLTPGQVVRFQVPPLFASTELNSTPFNNYQTFTIQSVGAAGDTFVINAPVGGITTFVFPTNAQWVAQTNYNYAIVVPVGEDTANALQNLNAQTPIINGIQVNGTQTGYLSDARVNTSYIYMYLGTGGTATALNATVSGPAGFAAADVCYWVAGKSEID